LSGGAGADTFDFNSATESAVGVTRDTITDFVAAFDKIDLSGIDADTTVANDQAFSFVASAFTNVAGQLRFDSGSSSVFGDVNGDGVADFEIALTGVTSLAAGDFIL
jgi:Ca2+-binding RTX toxin-like protein